MEKLREELGIHAELKEGRNGIYTVDVDGKIVAKKTLMGFPSEDEVVAAVAEELSRTPA